MRKTLIAFLTVLALVGCVAPRRAEAQFIGYTSAQSTTSTPYSGVTCSTAANSHFNVSNIGQNAHSATLIYSSGANSQIAFSLQGSYDGTVFFDISDIGTGTVNANQVSSITAEGYYPVIAVAVGTCVGTGTFSIQYSGISLPRATATGTNQQGQITKNLFFNAAANTSANSAQIRTPFGSSAGVLQFTYAAAGPAGSTIQLQCGTNQSFSANVTNTFTLQTTGLSAQTFEIPSFPCPFFEVVYTSGGASGASFDLDYSFVPPGAAVAGTQYTHVTGTTATTVKGAPGFVHTVSVNTGAAGTINLFDLPSASCTGTPSTSTVAVITATTTTLQSFLYDVQFFQGICVKASVGMDFTVSFQ